MGGEQSLRTLDGDIKVKIPEGVTHGEVLRVKGRGVPMSHNKRGDLLVRIVIDVPKKVSKDVRKLLEELKEKGV